MELATKEAELEKQRALNDKLETDLLQMEHRKPNGVIFDAAAGNDAQPDALAGLELGKKANVNLLELVMMGCAECIFFYCVGLVGEV